MSSLFDTDLSNVVRRIVRTGLKPMKAYRDLAAGVGMLFGAAFLCAVGGFLLYNGAKVPMLLLMGLCFAVPGLYYAISALACFFDRSPVLVLDEKGLTYRSILYGTRVFTWDNIRTANLHRSLRNGGEMSATLTIKLFKPVDGCGEIDINVGDLDVSSSAIFEAVGRWANLS